MSTESPSDVVNTSTGLKAKTANETSATDEGVTPANVERRSGGDQVADAEPTPPATTNTTTTPTVTTTTTTNMTAPREGEVAEDDGEEEGFFVEEAQFVKAAQILMQYGRLVIVGPPRSGKTYFAHALLQFFKKKGYTPKFSMNFCGNCQRGMPRAEVGLKRIVLVDNDFDRLRMTDELMKGISSFIFDMQTVWHKKEWNSLFIVVTYPHLLMDLDRMEHGHDTKLLSHPQIIVKMTQDPRNPSLPFVPSVDSLMPFLTRVLRDQENSKLFSLLLAMNLQEIYTYSYRVEVTRGQMVRLGYGDNMGCHDLDRLSLLLKDVLFSRHKGGFINRDVYDACGLALGLNGMIVTLLRVCDAKFLVDHVRLDEDAQPSQTTLVVPNKHRAEVRTFTLARMHELLVKKGAGKVLSQHPSFCYPEIVKEFFQYCREQKGFAQQLMTAVDGDSGLPLLYWSLWAPSPHLSHSCLDILAQTVMRDSDLSEMVMSCLVACVLLSPHGSSIHLSVKDLLKRLYRFHFKHDASTMNVPLPFPECSTEDIQAKVDQVKASLQSRLCYLNDPALSIPPRLLSLSTSEDAVALTMSTDQWYLILRLLTDTDKDEKDHQDNTVLHIAASGGDTEVLGLIVKSGASLTAKNKRGLTPPQVDEKKKKNREVQRKPAEDANSRNLLTAAKDGDLEAVKVLLCLGASLQVQDSVKDTPLHLASRGGHTEVVSVMLLLKAGVDAQNADKQTPLHASCASGHLQVARLLLDHGADVRTQDCQRSLPLHEACRQGLPDLVALLVSHGADVNGKDKKGTTPLYLACQGGHVEAAEVLLRGHAQVNAKNGAEGESALHAACQARHPEVVSLLLHHQADVHLKDAHGRTPIVREMGLQGPVFDQLLNSSTV